MSTIEAKRREFSRLFHDSHIDLPNLREYFNIYSGLRRHTKGSESYNEIRDQLREVPNYLQISRDINRYRTIYDRAITLENQIARAASNTDSDHITSDMFIEADKRSVITYTYQNGRETRQTTLAERIVELRDIVIGLAARTQDLGLFKFQLDIVANFTKDGNLDDIIQSSITTKPFTRSSLGLFTVEIDREMKDIQTRIEEAQLRGSGFVFLNFRKIEIMFHRIIHYRGNKWFQLPKPFHKMTCIINPKNDDNKCFIYAVLIALHYKEIEKNRNRVSQYTKYVGNYDWSMFPDNQPVEIDTRTMKTFEESNNIAVFITMPESYVSDKGRSYLTNLQYAPQIKTSTARAVIFLAYFEKQVEGELVGHYTAVVNQHALFCQDDRRNGFMCPVCRMPFNTMFDMCRHYDELCADSGCTAREYVDKDVLNDHAADSEPYENTLYYDFESALVPQPDGSDLHIPISFITCFKKFSELGKPGIIHYDQAFQGEDHCMQQFYNHIIEVIHKIDADFHICKIDRSTIPSVLASACESCGCPFEDESEIRRDHSHITGGFRNFICNRCNTKRVEKRSTLNIIAHNANRYDAQMILKFFTKKANETFRLEHGIKIISTNRENFIAFEFEVSIGKNNNGEAKKYTIRFLDSFKYISQSLAQLSKFADKEFPSLDAYLLTHHSEDKDAMIKHMNGKMFFPYTYFDSADKYYTSEFPPIEHFTYGLNKDCITEEEYKEESNFYHKYCKTLGDYNKLYQVSDVCLLADAFEKFRHKCIAQKEIDVLASYTIPAYAYKVWKRSLLKPKNYGQYTNEKYNRYTMKTVPNSEMFAMFNIRGGYTCINQRKVTANIPNYPNYDPSKPTVYIRYVDVNSLYPTAMVNNLPLRDFRWEDPTKFTAEHILSLKDEEFGRGFRLTVDLTYPHDVQDATVDLPLSITRALVSY